MRSTERYLGDLTGQEPIKVMEAMTELGNREKSVRSRLVALVRDGDELVAARAALLLGNSRQEEASQALAGALQHESAAVRVAALQALGKQGYEPAASAVSEMLLDQAEEVEVRMSAAYALGMIGGAGSVPGLAAALGEVPEPASDDEAEAAPDETAGVRVAAARALGMARQSKGIEALGQALQLEREPSPEVRVAAAYALGDVGRNGGDQSSREVAVRSLLMGTEDENGDVRVASLHSLGQLNVPQALSAQVGQALAEGLHDDHYWARKAAERAKAVVRIAQ